MTLDPIVKDLETNEEKKLQIVKIPGKEVITQPIYQEYHQNTDVHHVQNPVLNKVQFDRKVPIPVPVMKKIPIYRGVPVPLPSREPVESERVIVVEVPRRNGSSEEEDFRRFGPAYGSAYQNNQDQIPPYMNL